MNDPVPDTRIPHRDSHGARSRTLALLVAALVIVTTVILAVGYGAIEGWRHSGAQLTERRANEKATLLSVALDRDMKGVQASVLSRIGSPQLAFRTPYDLVDTFASAFARFPYPESFFVWRRTPGGHDETYVFTRSERPAPWLGERPSADQYPVAVHLDPQPLAAVSEALRATSASEPLRLQNLTIAGRPYQSLSLVLFGRGDRWEPIGAVGFLVDLHWVREQYFDDLTRQIASVVGDSGVALAIVDDRGQLVTATRELSGADRVSDRVFPLAFADRSLLAAQPSAANAVPLWTARAAADPAQDGLPRSWYGLWWLMTLAAGAALVGVVLVGRTLRVTAELAEMKSEFVSTVTHDLKTPLALIKLVGETLVLGRYSSPETIRQYAAMLSSEAGRLTLRIDNLLSYARITEARDRYHFQTVDLLDVVHESLRRSMPRLRGEGFDVDSNLTEAPSVRADRAALLQVLDNLIDNAIKYSGQSRHIQVGTSANADTAFVSIRDWGIGIPRDEHQRVFEKFYRARNAGASGSGLGLAIAATVLKDHGGAIYLDAPAGGGTLVTIAVPRRGDS